MRTTTHTLTTEADTQALAQALAPTFKAGDLLLLQGTLGAGKSTFARHLIRALGTQEKHIPSPTYTLYQEYPDATPPVLHLDAYRLTSEEDFIALDLLPHRQTHLFIIEWPQNIEYTTTHPQNPHGHNYLIELKEENTQRTATLTHLNQS